MSITIELPQLTITPHEDLVYCRRDTTKPNERMSFDESPEREDIIELRGLSSKSLLFYSALGNTHIFTANFRDINGNIISYDGNVILETLRRNNKLSDIEMHHVSSPKELMADHIHKIQEAASGRKDLLEEACTVYMRLVRDIKPLVFF